MLGFADSRVLMDANVSANSAVYDTIDGMPHSTGPCQVIALPRNQAQGPPTEAEKAGLLVVPPSDADPADFAGPPACEDTPADAVASVPATLASLRDNVFRPSCSFSACHAGPSPAQGLDLTAADLRAELLGHTAAGGHPLLVPGEPESSWLLTRISRCEASAGDAIWRSMPLNSPTLLDPGLVAAVRDWIAAGAPE